MKSSVIFITLLSASISGCQSQEPSSGVENQTNAEATVALTTPPKLVYPIGKTTLYAEVIESLDRDKIRQEIIEKQIDEWTPAPCDQLVPIPALLDSMTSIQGQWLRSCLLEGSSLTILWEKSGKYSVEYFTTSDLSRWVLRRTATFASGVLILDRPVKDHLWGVFDRLFVLKIGGTTCMVPPCGINKLQEQVDKDGVFIGDPIVIEYLSLGPADERKK